MKVKSRVLKPLLFLELCNLFGLNKFRYEKSKKERSKYIALSAVWLLLIIMVACYVGGLVYGLVLLGIPQIAPAYLYVIASLLVFVFAIFTAGYRMFSAKSYDILSSLPIEDGEIVAARFLAMYVEYLLLVVLIFIPGMTVYGILAAPAFGFYLIMTVAAVFLPAIPLVAATAIGSLIMGISSRMRNKSLVQSLLAIAFVVVVMVVSTMSGFAAEELTPDMLLELTGMISVLIGKLYPPAIWATKLAFEESTESLLQFVLFLGISIGILALMLTVISRFFHGILQGLMATSAKHDYRMEKLKATGRMKSLIIREWKRYFASSAYVTNTIVGPIMGTLMCVAICVTGTEGMQELFPIGRDITGLLPLAVAGVFTMMTTTSCSISLEGKQIWIMQSLPVTAKELWDAKIALNLILMAPFYLVSVVLLVLGTTPSITEALWLVFIPLVMALFATVIGISVNIKLHSFDWEKEEIVVKQSASAALGGFAGMLVSIAFSVLIFVTSESMINLVYGAFSIVILAVTYLLYQWNNKVKLENL